MTKRLDTIFDMLDGGGIIADIGADHGYLTKKLVCSGKAKFIVATDISALSLKKTEKLAKNEGFFDKIACKVGFGLDVLAAKEAEEAVIAGMGGYEIIKILESKNRKDGIKKFVLQANQNTIELRKYLNRQNYYIENDNCLFENGKFYDILKVNKTDKQQKLSEEDIWFGKTNLVSPLFQDDFLKKLMKTKLSLEKRFSYLNEEDQRKIKCINKLLKQ